MTDTKCPSCQVMLDLQKFASGACEWCGQRLPHDMVTHARERVEARKEGHRRLESSHTVKAIAPTNSGRVLGVIPFLGLGVVLVLAAYLAVTAIQNQHLRPDTYQVIAGALLVLLIGGGIVWRMLLRHPAKHGM